MIFYCVHIWNSPEAQLWQHSIVSDWLVLPPSNFELRSVVHPLLELYCHKVMWWYAWRVPRTKSGRKDLLDKRRRNVGRIRPQSVGKPTRNAIHWQLFSKGGQQELDWICQGLSFFFLISRMYKNSTQKKALSLKKKIGDLFSRFPGSCKGH